MLHGEKAQYILLDMDYQYLLSSEQYTMWAKLDKKYKAENIYYPPVLVHINWDEKVIGWLFCKLIPLHVFEGIKWKFYENITSS